jgi:hypothetical protein
MHKKFLRTSKISLLIGLVVFILTTSSGSRAMIHEEMTNDDERDAIVSSPRTQRGFQTANEGGISDIKTYPHWISVWQEPGHNTKKIAVVMLAGGVAAGLYAMGWGTSCALSIPYMYESPILIPRSYPDCIVGKTWSGEGKDLINCMGAVREMYANSCWLSSGLVAGSAAFLAASGVFLWSYGR